ncbi:CAMK/CAMKL/Kin4 protein kinase [Mycena rebaudengoi]|nr:CAMK/CAMKL/Kin4 protein kinase [Mycena rebaudengoi]
MSSSLTIPSPSRPVSVAAGPTSPPSRRQQPPHRASHQVASSSSAGPTSSGGNNGGSDDPPYSDVYSHPAAIAYASAHPRRTIPKFGPYLLLQTLGEGEFGKVKLGLHAQWAEEVAVKLIRRGNVDSAVRMSKVEREIEVLRTLKHPNIVRLYDVIETDKYIGIIIEYASGGELFDHILAHRYLRERDASKLFSQLVSGVWYIHQKKIVHRDLKLENLLLDRHRNVIITDFGFANRFEHRADDLMQTSCGSPCYAAPELVISEGLYVGSAVDIWSCGVILYAMLAGYLPFDDDPANPDGDNINLLYKYIVNTPLSFPEYISEEARDLLGLMLVPDPRKRASLEAVMAHPWLAAYHLPRTEPDPEALDGERPAVAFGRTVDELEMAAMEQHQQKRLAYQRQMRGTGAANSNANVPMGRTQSQAQVQNVPPMPQSPPLPARSRTAQPEFLYVSPTGGSGGVGVGVGEEDDPFGPAPGSRRPRELERDGEARGEKKGKGGAAGEGGSGSGGKKDGDKFRHTIQVEYEERRGRAAAAAANSATGSATVPIPIPPTPKTNGAGGEGGEGDVRMGSPASASGSVTERRERRRRGSADAADQPRSVGGTPTSTRAGALSTTPTSTPTRGAVPPIATTNIGTPTGTPTRGPVSPTTTPTKQGHARAPSSASVGKALPPNPSSPPTTWKAPHSPTKSVVGPGEVVRTPVMEVFGAEKEGDKEKTEANNDTKDDSEKTDSAQAGKEKDGKDGKKSRRNTLTGLTVMVDPIRSIRNNMSMRKRDASGATTTGSMQLAPPAVKAPPHTGGGADGKTFAQQTGPGANVSQPDVGSGGGAGMQASTSKARKVMQWFRKGRESITVGAPATPASATSENASTPTATTNSNVSVAGSEDLHVVVVTTPTSAVSPHHQQQQLSPIVTATLAGGRGQRTPSSASHADSSFAGAPPPSATTPTTTTGSSFASRFRRSVNIVGGGGGGSVSNRGTGAAVPPTAGGALRIHHGPVDTATITTGQPPAVMQHVKGVLVGMGVEIYVESEFKYRCIRPKHRRAGKGVGSVPAAGGAGVAAFTMVGSAGSNGVDKRGLPLPSQSGFSGGGMLRGLLMRRQSSQVSAAGAAGSTSFDGDDSLNSSGILTAEPGSQTDTVYGETPEDAGDEVRFSVELTRLDRLNDTYSLDIRRLKGNLRSYKFLYDTLRKRADLQQR